ncbi:hypothetical protein TanjilG_31543 [Lupinus angustifolius]|uniref:CG-1 domain-containing protein n=1 Tax=Lupinus angustifolius TaxID=3871 RepID=A0A4P1RU05_LUPAN|nr:hypothetical protein TanjilG_31543 [Lupinus angustifolius]
MMTNNLAEELVGSEIHGFHTMQELDVGSIMKEARTRWLRPNEIHAILCNPKYFTIHVKPVNLPKSGTIVLFDRKMLRNFRKDGHNWKKKKDGKTVKEAHEHLKARTFFLGSVEHIVLVHYRETQEVQGSPVTPVNSNSSSSDPVAPWIILEEIDSGTNTSYAGEINHNSAAKSHELRLHEINTLEWDDLVLANDLNTSTVPNEGKVQFFDQQNQALLNNSFNNVASDRSAEISSFDNLTQPIAGSNTVPYNFSESVNLQTIENQVNPKEHRNDPVSASGVGSFNNVVNDKLQSQDSFGMWVNIMSDSPCSADESALESSISSVHDSYSPLVVNSHLSSLPEQVFNLTDVSPAWVSSTEKSKVLLTGFFHKDYEHLSKSNLLCVCGDVSVPAEIVQVGVYRCWVSPHSPGFVNLYLSFDGHKPISQLVNFEYRTTVLHDPAVSMEQKDNWDEFQIQMKLAHLLFAKQKILDVFSSNVSPNALKEARQFAFKTSYISNSWQYLMKSTEDNKIPFSQAKDALFGIALKNRLKDWLLERIVSGCLSLDFRDKFGWTALHWAAYYGREKMVATLLSAGAKPNLVTDPNPQNPGGCTAADIAYMKGYDGLAAYLSEKSLVEHFNDMSIAGNIRGSLETSTTEPVGYENLTEDQAYLKDTLTAYRTAAEAAARIQAAFREHSLKLRTEAVEFFSPEGEARAIVAAMKIQHAFRNFETRKIMAAAARIQHTYRTWKTRKEFLNMRRQAIKIQAAFRCFKLRKHYRKILWSVGVVEKAVLRWRLKRRGFRGLQVNHVEAAEDQKQESDVEEDFFRTGRKQASERVERSVVRVQAMFRSKKAQQEYRRMKLALNQAKLEREYEELLNTEVEMQCK